jgi:hypothetical protein
MLITLFVILQITLFLFVILQITGKHAEFQNFMVARVPRIEAPFNEVGRGEPIPKQFTLNHGRIRPHMETECIDCRKLKATLECGQCKESLCKKCAVCLPNGAFQMMKEIPESLSHIRYCNSCYSNEVESALSEYEAILERAKRVFVFFKTRKKGIPILKKEKHREIIEACPDRDETILRLAFISASRGMNAIVDVEVESKKIRNEAYQTSSWSGSGIPAQVDESRIYDEDLQEEMYR